MWLCGWLSGSMCDVCFCARIQTWSGSNGFHKSSGANWPDGVWTNECKEGGSVLHAGNIGNSASTQGNWIVFRMTTPISIKHYLIMTRTHGGGSKRRLTSHVTSTVTRPHSKHITRMSIFLVSLRVQTWVCMSPPDYHGNSKIYGCNGGSGPNGSGCKWSVRPCNTNRKP